MQIWIEKYSLSESCGAGISLCGHRWRGRAIPKCPFAHLILWSKGQKAPKSGRFKNDGIPEPVNALLNWSYAVAAGRLSAELFARGACLAIGFLHADREGRYSLAYDALELLRPLIDEKGFRLCRQDSLPHGGFSRRAFREAQRRGARVARTVEGLRAGDILAE